MRYRINFEMSGSKESVESFLTDLVNGGPFKATDFCQVAEGIWAFDLSPKRSGIRIGFSKVVELQALLSRSMEIISVTRLQGLSLAAAS